MARKYNNSMVMVDGIRFDSRKEANRYIVLMSRQRQGGCIGNG